MNIVIENQILSPLTVFSIYSKSDNILIEKFDSYNKRTYRNRFIINSSSGPQMISIPLVKGKNQLLFTKVEISYDTKWISNLEKTIKTCYGSAAFFDFLFPDLISIFKKRHKYLYDLNNDLRNYIFDFLELDSKIRFTEEYIKEYNLDFVDLRDTFLPTSDIKPNKSSRKIQYTTIFNNKNNLANNPSIIDLLFSMGKYSLNILLNYPSK